MAVMYPQISGTPGRALLLENLLEYTKVCPDVWLARMREIAEFWRKFAK